MKGVNKRVIEIVQTDNDAIERVLVFLKPNSGNVKISHQKLEAEKYVSGLVSFRRIPWFKSKKAMYFGALMLTAVGIASVVWFLL